MKVLKRILIKLIILILVVGVCGGSALYMQGVKQCTADYILERYLNNLLNNHGEKAFNLLEKGTDLKLSKEEYLKAVSGKKYSLYTAYEIAHSEKTDENGEQMVTSHVRFQDSEGAVKAEEDFSVRLQADKKLEIFDDWKVLPDHCLVHDFCITAPKGSTVYLDAEPVVRNYLKSPSAESTFDTYQIPTILPGDISMTVRHPVLESVNTTINTMEESVDVSGRMPLKDAAKDSCKEIGVAVVKNLMTAAVQNNKKLLDASLDSVKKEAEAFVKKEHKALKREDAEFKSIAVSNYATQFSDIVFSEDGSLQTEMTLLYHYFIKYERTAYSEEEYDDDGYPKEIILTEGTSEDASVKLTLSWSGDEWSILSMEAEVTK